MDQNQPLRLTRVCGGPCVVGSAGWAAAKWRQTQLNRVAPACQLSKAARAAAAPPSAHISMSAPFPPLSHNGAAVCVQDFCVWLILMLWRLRDSSAVAYKTMTRAHYRLLAPGPLNRVPMDHARA